MLANDEHHILEWHEDSHSQCQQANQSSPARYRILEKRARHVALRSMPALVMPAVSSITLPYFS